MRYDPVKKGLGSFFNRTPFLRILFYRLLDLLLLRAWYIKKELRKYRKQNPEPAQVLDAGSGFGQYSYYMARMAENWNIRGVDIKSEQIEDCNLFFEKIRKGHQVRFEAADLTLLHENEKYNLILCVDVMEHIEDDLGVLRNYANALKPGGMVLISTPSDKGGSDVHNETGKSFIEEHVRNGYNIKEIEDKLGSAGFSKTEARYSYGIPGKISWLLSMKYPIILLNISKFFYIILPFYYLLTMPFSLVLNYLDVNMKHKSGTGLIVKGYKY